MTDETVTQETAPAKTRAPSLVATVNGVAHKLLKYAFPTKAIPFTVTVNGVETPAAGTAGRGAAYTYLLINNTGFYLPKNVTLSAGDEVEVAFPEGYKFDEVQAVRVSNYKPKRKAGETDDDAAQDADDNVEEQSEGQEAASEEAANVEPPKRAARRGKSK